MDDSNLNTITIAGPWLRTRAAAEYCGLTEPTMRTWRSLGKGPRWSKCGAAVVYRVEDLDRWIREGGRA